MSKLKWLSYCGFYYVLSNLNIVVAGYDTFMHDALLLYCGFSLVVMWLCSLVHGYAVVCALTRDVLVYVIWRGVHVRILA